MEEEVDEMEYKGGARKRWRGGRINIINPKDFYITIIRVSLSKPHLVLYMTLLTKILIN